MTNRPVVVSDATSQTLARGLRILDLLAEAAAPLSIAQVAVGLDVHRSVAYRLVRTLEASGLVVRDVGGGLLLGPHIVTLARSVAPDLRSAAQPVLQALADDLRVTAFLAVLDRAECVTLVTVEPRSVVASIAQRPGTRHSVLVGAPGIAVQTLLDAPHRVLIGLDPTESAEVASARSAGFARTQGEVIPGVTAVAAPLAATVPAAVVVLFVSENSEEHIVDRVRRAAIELASALR